MSGSLSIFRQVVAVVVVFSVCLLYSQSTMLKLRSEGTTSDQEHRCDFCCCFLSQYIYFFIVIICSIVKELKSAIENVEVRTSIFGKLVQALL